MKLLVTGSAGLIGSEVCTFFHKIGYEIHGVDNNQRAEFFGNQGETGWNRDRLRSTLNFYYHYNLDIRARQEVLQLVESIQPDAIVHAAAQPSHDKAASIPFDDFDINAVGTLNLLEAARRSCIDAPFIFLSTNKVYGDRPNRIQLKEYETRWDYDDTTYADGIPECFPIDQSTHSLFGASKVAADILVQEYGNYHSMPTCCLRGGCLTGPNHSSVELHGFLSYLVRCNMEDKHYTIYGYKGKQVRDNIHSEDVANFIWYFMQTPGRGSVYNLGGGYDNSCSIIEAIELSESVTGKPMYKSYQERNRIGDHICYYSDLTKARNDYPGWNLKYSLRDIIEQIVHAWDKRHHN